MTNGTSSSSSSWKFSVLSIMLMVVLTLSVVRFHSNRTGHLSPFLSFPSSSSSSSSVLLKSFMRAVPLTPSTKIDDDITRDEICRRYLYNFLNGTTDAKDECDGMYHAFETADCSGDEGVILHHSSSYYDWQSSNAAGTSKKEDFADLIRTAASAISHRHKQKDGNVTDDNIVMDDYFQWGSCCSSIYRYYTKHCHQSKLASTKLLGLVIIMIVCSGVKGLMRTFGWDWIPDAAACIVVGATAGGILRLISPTVINEKMAFNNDLFLRILLPPIVFQAALSIDKRAFRRDIFPILSFAIVGTGLSAVVIGLVTTYLSEFGGTSLPLLESLLFGSLISSIDPVATLGILQAVGVNPSDTLYTLVFGESLLNDGVAIVLFQAFLRHLGDATVVAKATIQETLRQFAVVTLGSMAIGLVCGLVGTLYFVALRGKQSAVTEVAVFFCWALIPYYVSDAVGLSGIIAIMTMGFFMDYYVIGGFQSEEAEWMEYIELRRDQHIHEAAAAAQPDPRPCCCSWSRCCYNVLNKSFSGCGHLSSRSRKHVGFVTEIVASVMETAIFAYLGLFLFQDHSWNFRLNGIAIFGCVVSRAGMVLLLSLLINFFVWVDFENRIARLGAILCCRSTTHDDDSAASVTKAYVDQKTQCIMILAGVRGAVSFALAENIPVYDAVTKHGSKFKAELKAMTASSILVTLFVFGALTYFVVRRPPPSNPEPDTVTGRLTRRLLSGPLASTIEEQVEDENSIVSSSDSATEDHGTRRRPPLLR